MYELFSFQHKKVLNSLPKAHRELVSATCVKFEVSYSKKFKRYEKMNVMYSLYSGGCKLFSSRHKKVLNSLPKAYKVLFSAKCVKFEVSYSKKFRRYEKMNDIVALGEDVNSSVFGIKRY